MSQPRHANFYDLLKCVALVAMTCDHLAFFLLPEYQWLRVIGRIAAPIFLLLVGYNGSFRFRMPLFIAAVLVTLMDGLLVNIWLPQNVLWTILIIRAVMQYALPRFKHHEIAIVSVVLIPLTMPFFDFGSLGLVFALIGYHLRDGRDGFAKLWMFISLPLYYLWTYFIILAALTMFEAMLLAVLLAMIGVVLFRVKYLAPVTLAPHMVRLFAARALYYYVAHKFVLEVTRLL